MAYRTDCEYVVVIHAGPQHLAFGPFKTHAKAVHWKKRKMAEIAEAHPGWEIAGWANELKDPDEPR